MAIDRTSTLAHFQERLQGSAGLADEIVHRIVLDDVLSQLMPQIPIPVRPGKNLRNTIRERFGIALCNDKTVRTKNLSRIPYVRRDAGNTAGHRLGKNIGKSFAK